MAKKILVTGADGFIGSHLTEALVRRGYDVRAFVLYNSFNSWGWLDNLPADIRSSLDVFAGDVRDPHGVLHAMQGCEAVLHLAALIAIPYSYHSPDSYVETNVKGTLNVLQAARSLGLRRVVQTSTSEVYGTAQFVPITEEHPLQGQSPYSASKIGADQMAIAFHRSFGTPVTLVRPFNTYGPRQSARAVIPAIITQLTAGERSIKLGALHPTRDFSFVADTASGMIAALESEHGTGEVINLGSNFEISIGDTAKLIAEVMEKEITIVSDEVRLRPKLSEVERLWADNRKARELLGWSPTYAGKEGFRRGLKETATWFKNPDNLRGYKPGTYALLIQIDPSAVLAAIRGCLPTDRASVALHEPHFVGNEWRYVKECLDTGWVSSAGGFVDRFEKDLAELTSAARAVAVVNGTAALHAALVLIGVKPGDDVIVPTLTFIATANAVTYCGAQPHFVDSEERTGGLDPAKLDEYLRACAEIRDGFTFDRRTGRRISAVVPMHVFGHPVDLDALVELCARWKLTLVEDAAESLGSYYKGRHTGTFGRIGILSFNGNKIVTTGGGGAILTNDIALGERAKHLTTTARVKHPWTVTHDEIGYNYRLPNLNAALGCAQLENLPRFVEAKRSLALKYAAAFSKMDGLHFIAEPAGTKSNYWLNTLLLDRECAPARDAILSITNAAGIMTRPAWTLMHTLPMFRDCPRSDLNVAESLQQRIINLPSSSSLVSSESGEKC